MNWCISKSYTTTKNTIDRQYTDIVREILPQVIQRNTLCKLEIFFKIKSSTIDGECLSAGKITRFIILPFVASNRKCAIIE